MDAVVVSHSLSRLFNSCHTFPHVFMFCTVGSNLNLRMIERLTRTILSPKKIGCYAQKFGARGYGYLGMSSLGLMSDIKDKEWQR